MQYLYSHQFGLKQQQQQQQQPQQQPKQQQQNNIKSQKYIQTISVFDMLMYDYNLRIV